jgi:uncharacterized protein YndB with AHSA1/START domain
MKKAGEAPPGVRIGDEALKAKTGRNWSEWFAVLDRTGAAKMNHTAIADHLYSKLGCPGWWSEMVAVGYEQARGLREKYQRPEGYSISKSKVLAAPLGRLFGAWQDAQTRARWLKEPITIRKATRSKSLRITWTDGKTSLEVLFYPKGPGKSQVVVQHSKLADARAAERMKQYWGGKLEGLKGILER